MDVAARILALLVAYGDNVGTALSGALVAEVEEIALHVRGLALDEAARICERRAFGCEGLQRAALLEAAQEIRCGVGTRAEPGRVHLLAAGIKTSVKGLGKDRYGVTLSTPGGRLSCWIRGRERALAAEQAIADALLNALRAAEERGAQQEAAAARLEMAELEESARVLAEALAAARRENTRLGWVLVRAPGIAAAELLQVSALPDGTFRFVVGVPGTYLALLALDDRHAEVLCGQLRPILARLVERALGAAAGPDGVHVVRDDQAAEPIENRGQHVTEQHQVAPAWGGGKDG